MDKEILRFLVPTGMLGYGFPLEDFKKGLAMNPDYITIDSGSTDSGPQKLALGEMTCGRANYYEELEILLKETTARKIPLLISSAGGDGSNEHVDVFADIVRELSRNNRMPLKMALVYADMDKQLVQDKLASGKITPCGPVDELTAQDVEEATVIVAQMGAEPFLKVFEEHPDVDIVISGRSYDPSPIGAMALRHGFPAGLAWHMGKILECGGLCTEPSTRCIIGELRRDHFDIIPLAEGARCTTYSVAAHTLYEKSHPYILPGPGGHIDLSACRYEQHTDSIVRVEGSQFKVSAPYTVKLEGARTCGYRAITVAGVRDPILIEKIDPFLESVRDLVNTLPEKITSRAELIFHVYGKDGVMGELEPLREARSHELCIIVEVAAPDPDTAKQVCNRARIGLLHNPYEGRMATSGNIGLPFTPLEIPLGQVCEFNVYHLMEIDDPAALFPVKYEEVR